ncbi:riboflavin synthase subunit alpha [Rhizobium sp. CECT 9324]|jgi:riboflavin synthase|uniref:riboflavin synthase subunit alpha n=1 Tax=Rhizobium sp. CECT 9324 TaxID=2845820 RepID=UPI000DE0D91D|nr:riboflavin synthase subunit alpha [Rhizobium sp. CECT 9324]CAH0342148.1 Riboflavin synthase [Rhizobium sp. CECT 9324]
MYTGIVQTVAPVTNIVRYDGYTQFHVELPERLLVDLQIGASVSIEGVCLSVTTITGNRVTFDAMDATLERTNLGILTIGDGVNVERSAKPTDENGGHNIAGHIASTAELVAAKMTMPGAFIRFRIPEEWAKYVFKRGYLAVNGASLTVAEADDDTFTINLIPETLRQTTFPRYKPGDPLNIEIDHQTMVMVDVVERTLERLMARA